MQDIFNKNIDYENFNPSPFKSILFGNVVSFGVSAGIYILRFEGRHGTKSVRIVKR